MIYISNLMILPLTLLDNSSNIKLIKLLSFKFYLNRSYHKWPDDGILMILFFPRPPQLSIFNSIPLSSKTEVTSFNMLFNFITQRGLLSKLDVSIDNESETG